MRLLVHRVAATGHMSWAWELQDDDHNIIGTGTSTDEGNARIEAERHARLCAQRAQWRDEAEWVDL